MARWGGRQPGPALHVPSQLHSASSGLTKPWGFTARTGQSRLLMTFSAVFPMKTPLSPVRATVPITTRSAASRRLCSWMTVSGAPRVRRGTSLGRGPPDARTSARNRSIASCRATWISSTYRSADLRASSPPENAQIMPSPMASQAWRTVTSASGALATRHAASTTRRFKAVRVSGSAASQTSRSTAARMRRGRLDAVGVCNHTGQGH